MGGGQHYVEGPAVVVGLVHLSLVPVEQPEQLFAVNLHEPDFHLEVCEIASLHPIAKILPGVDLSPRPPSILEVVQLPRHLQFCLLDGRDDGEARVPRSIQQLDRDFEKFRVCPPNVGNLCQKKLAILEEYGSVDRAPVLRRNRLESVGFEVSSLVRLSLGNEEGVGASCDVGPEAERLGEREPRVCGEGCEDLAAVCPAVRVDALREVAHQIPNAVRLLDDAERKGARRHVLYLIQQNHVFEKRQLLDLGPL
mmetsp:Transcript_25295/g.60453  ORF Transcript_25295/g.60453 Transcript_25295/m.60453 type:complete len:253 (+) Transcript_25295:466-1224(+)